MSFWILKDLFLYKGGGSSIHQEVESCKEIFSSKKISVKEEVSNCSNLSKYSHDTMFQTGLWE